MSRLSSSIPDIKRAQKGIFEIAFERPRSLRAFFQNFKSNLQLTWSRLRDAVRLVKDLCLVSPVAFCLYVVAVLWPSVLSALYLCLAAFLLQAGAEFVVQSQIADAKIETIKELCAASLLCPFANAFFEQLRYQCSRRIKHGFREHFYPILARRTLAFDLDTAIAPDVQAVLPQPWAFEMDNSIGWEFLCGLTCIVQNLVTAALQIFVISAILASRNLIHFTLGILGCTALLTTMIFIPTNGLGGVGYSFWTHHPSYYHLAALHEIIFDTKYRETLLKDGSINFVLHEYERCTRELGFLSFDAEMLTYGLPVAWYWQILQVLVETPLIGFFLTNPSNKGISSATWLTTGLFVQFATRQLGQNIKKVRQSQKPLLEVLALAETFYKFFAIHGSFSEGGRSYPDETHSLPSGMRISFRNVSLVHRSSLSARPAVKDVSFDIAPGSFVLLVGENGSGKTSLLHLLSRLFTSSAGDISIDGIPIQDFEAQSLRESMVTLLQSEEVYPLSIRENLSMSLTESDRAQDRLKAQSFDIASKSGGSNHFIENLVGKYETVLNPVGRFNTSSDVFGNGVVSPVVLEEMYRNAPRASSIPISNGEKQRLIASRAFMKLNNHPDVRLLVVDEPTTSLDARAERDIFAGFREHSSGKTTIFVTHRFRNLAHRADLILCMREGQLVQQGTHEQLMAYPEGEYAKLYNAQTPA